VAAVRRGVGWYSSQEARAKRSSARDEKEDRFARTESIGIPIDIAVYREHGQDAHATTGHNRSQQDTAGHDMI
jgi:hypothetical protein